MVVDAHNEQGQDTWAERTHWLEMFKRSAKGAVAAINGLRKIGPIQPLKPALRAILRPIVEEVFDLK